MPERTPASQRGTRRTVVIAGLANLSVMLIKITAGVITGSSAMLAEAAHSAADTLNQGFLLTSLRRSRRPADAEHPFGYGQERYFWSLLAAFGIFVAGAGFSVFEACRKHRTSSSTRPNNPEAPITADEPQVSRDQPQAGDEFGNSSRRAAVRTRWIRASTRETGYEFGHPSQPDPRTRDGCPDSSQPGTGTGGHPPMCRGRCLDPPRA